MEKNKDNKENVCLNREKENTGQHVDEHSNVLNGDAHGKTLFDIWNQSSFSMEHEEKAQMYEEIRATIGDTTSNNRPTKEKNRFRWIYVAASVVASVILCMIGFRAGIDHQISISESEEIVFRVNNGQKAEVNLSDGTKVFLNSSSSLTYNKNYNSVERKVKLEGEAYFKIVTNKEKPFVVQSNGINVEALGTTFNVRAYDSDHAVAVILIEGKVKVSDFSKEMILNPNERLHYDLITNSMQKDIISPNISSLLWLDNELDFYREDLFNICLMLQRMYDVNFVFSNENIKKEKFTGLIKNNSLNNVLEVLSSTSSRKLKYKRVSGDTIYIYN